MKRSIDKSPYEKGAAAASRGARRNAPYRIASIEGKEWLRGWDARTAELQRRESEEWYRQYGPSRRH